MLWMGTSRLVFALWACSREVLACELCIDRVVIREPCAMPRCDTESLGLYWRDLVFADAFCSRSLGKHRLDCARSQPSDPACARSRMSRTLPVQPCSTGEVVSASSGVHSDKCRVVESMVISTSSCYINNPGGPCRPASSENSAIKQLRQREKEIDHQRITAHTQIARLILEAAMYGHASRLWIARR